MLLGKKSGMGDISREWEIYGVVWLSVILPIYRKSGYFSYNSDAPVHGISLSNRRYTGAIGDIPETTGYIPE